LSAAFFSVFMHPRVDSSSTPDHSRPPKMAPLVRPSRHFASALVRLRVTRVV
jgi:hypothetical protein